MNSSGTTITYSCIHPKEIHFFGPAESYYLVNIPVCAVNMILLVFIVFGNVVVMIAYWRSKNLQTVPNMLLMTLALSDMVVGLLTEPLFIASLIRNMLGLKPSCLLALLCSLANKFCAGTSLTTVSLVVSLERYLAIVHPFKHRRYVTKTKAKLLVFSLWFVLLFMNSLLFLGVRYEGYLLVSSTLISAGVAFTGFACYRILRKWNTSFARAISINSVQNAARPESPRRSSAPQFSAGLEKKDFKITVTMFYIMGAIILCYTPILGTFVYGIIRGMDEIYLKYLRPNVLTLVYLNSLLNPIIYCLRNRKFIIAIRNLSGFNPEERKGGRCHTMDHPLSFQQNTHIFSR